MTEGPSNELNNEYFSNISSSPLKFTTDQKNTLCFSSHLRNSTPSPTLPLQRVKITKLPPIISKTPPTSSNKFNKGDCPSASSLAQKLTLPPIPILPRSGGDFVTEAPLQKTGTARKLKIRGLKKFIEKRGGCGVPPSWVKDFPCRSRFAPDLYVYNYEGISAPNRNVSNMRRCKNQGGRCEKCGVYSVHNCTNCNNCEEDCTCVKEEGGGGGGGGGNFEPLSTLGSFEETLGKAQRILETSSNAPNIYPFPHQQKTPTKKTERERRHYQTQVPYQMPYANYMPPPMSYPFCPCPPQQFFPYPQYPPPFQPYAYSSMFPQPIYTPQPPMPYFNVFQPPPINSTQFENNENNSNEPVVRTYVTCNNETEGERDEFDTIT